MTRDRSLEVFCAWCHRNLENLNEYINTESFRWSQASHGICKECKEKVIQDNKKRGE